MDALLAQLAGHDVAGLAAVAGAVDDEVEVRAQPRLELGEGAVEVGLGQRRGSPGCGSSCRSPRAARRGRGRPCRAGLLASAASMTSSPGLDEDALAEGEARGPRTRSRRSPSDDSASQDRERSPPAHRHHRKIAWARWLLKHCRQPCATLRAVGKIVVSRCRSSPPTPWCSAQLQDRRDQQDGRPADPRARQAARRGQGRARRRSALPLGARAAVRGAGRALRPAGRRAPPPGAPASCCVRPSARAAAASRPRSSCRTAPSCSTPSARRARPRTRSIGWPSRSCARPRRACPRGCSGATWRPGCCGCTASTRRSTAARGCAAAPPAWRPCATTMRPRASCAMIAGPPRARCCPPAARAFLVDVFRRPPEATRRRLAHGGAALEGFHRELIIAPSGARPALAARVSKDVARERRAVTLQEIVFALAALLVRPRLPHPPALGRRGGRGHHAPRDLPARARARSPGASAYVQPSRRPADGRYGENPNRLYKHQQFQVILKPPPADIQDLYLGSLTRARHRPRRSTTCASRRTTGSRRRSAPGASAGRSCSTGRRSRSSPTSSRRAASTSRPISGEITYGLERIAMYLQDVDDVYDARVVEGRALRRGAPRGGVPALALLVRAGRRRAAPRALREARWPRAGGCWRSPGGRSAAAAYDWCLKSSHAFNVLDARGAISVSQRAGMILSIRKLACAVAAAYVAAADGRSRRGGRGRPWLSSCWRSASRRCRRPGCPALTEQLARSASPSCGRARAPGASEVTGALDAAAARAARPVLPGARPTARRRSGARP